MLREVRRQPAKCSPTVDRSRDPRPALSPPTWVGLNVRKELPDFAVEHVGGLQVAEVSDSG
jgi:hypothetical protein